ncbi:MAG: ABC-F family ATP-binding cassette domain-containing protein [Christensenellaceae bacterium]|jgi:ATP-binding cassette subfamily F protein 3|nr:ABC-F family ATP-binding cassette domain-containing protein [Christensenellaceae bacterium]
MIILQISGLTKAFGAEEILKGVNLTVQERDRVGLVGSNGSGKTTLLRMLCGELSRDRGQLQMARGLRVGYHSQLDDLDSPLTVYEELKTVFEPLFEMEKRLRELEGQMGGAHAEGDEAFLRLSEEYTKLTDRFEEAGGYGWNSRLQGVLTGLGFHKGRYDQAVSSLSGGERTRLKLGKLLLRENDLLLLDEPTNHLDLDSTKWLEDYLKAYKGAVLVVSHDRYFLDALCNSIAELSFGRIEQYSGNYTRYLSQRAEVMERRMKEYTLQQKEIEREKRIIAMYRSFNREAAFVKAKSREKRLAKMEIKERPVEEHNVFFRFTAGRGTGQDVLLAERLSKAYGGRTLFEGIDLHIRAGERIALLGPNGIGKTTLLRILCGLEAPDSGEFRLGAGVQLGYYDQQQQGLSMEKTVLDEVWDEFPRMEQTDVRSALGLFLFTGDDVFAPVSALSGGERGRVLMTKLMIRQDNFLILDEPTNHLDMDSREVLENALDDFAGTILSVSHDRYFINRVATKVLVMENGGVTEYLGNYDDYLEKLSILSAQGAEEEPPQKTKTAQREEKRRERLAREEAQKYRAQLMNVESQIAEREEKMTKLEIELSDPDLYKDPGSAQRLNKRYAELKAEIEKLYGEWEGLQS